MLGLKIGSRPIERERVVIHPGNHKTMMISLSALAAAVPVLWLGGCLATRRPAWFLSRQTVRKMRHKVGDFKDRMGDIKDRMEDVKDKIEDWRYKARHMNAKDWFTSLHF